MIRLCGAVHADPRSRIKELLKSVKSLAIDSQPHLLVVPVLSCTTMEPIDMACAESSTRKHSVPLPLLSTESVDKVLDAMLMSRLESSSPLKKLTPEQIDSFRELKDHWRCKPGIRLLALMTGGLPRAVEVLVDAVLNPSSGSLLFFVVCFFFCSCLNFSF